MAEPTIKNEIARLLKRLVDLYLESSEPVQLHQNQRTSCSALGIFGYAVLHISVLSAQNGHVFQIVDDLNQILTKKHYITVPVITIGVLFLSIFAMAFASMIGRSLKNGTPLRFFLMGFFLTALLMNVVMLSLPAVSPGPQLE